MAKREIEAKKVLSDIGSGMDHHSLMAEYRLSIEELRRMPAFMGTCFIDDIGCRCLEEQDDPLSEDEVLEDIRSGMDARRFTRKYGISRRAFRSILDHLLLSGLLERSEVSSRANARRSSIELQLPGKLPEF
jgi:hypothetical protein